MGSILGAFETGETFLPETYSIYQSTPGLFCHDAFEIQASDFHRVSQCSIFYSPAPRRWLRLTAIVTISIESQHWNTWKVKTLNAASAPNLHYFPVTLERQFESQLRSSDGVRQDSVLEAYSGSQPDFKLSMVKNPPGFEVRDHLRWITNKLYHRGLPAYREKDLVHQLLPSTLFVAKIPGQSRWWLERRFRSVKLLESHLNELDVITSCSNSPRILAFVSFPSYVHFQFSRRWHALGFQTLAVSR